MNKVLLYVLVFFLGFMLRGCMDNIEGLDLIIKTKETDQLIMDMNEKGFSIQNICHFAAKQCENTCQGRSFNNSRTGEPKDYKIIMDGEPAKCSSLKGRCSNYWDNKGDTGLPTSFDAH